MVIKVKSLVDVSVRVIIIYFWYWQVVLLKGYWDVVNVLMLRGEVESNLNKKFVRVSEVISMFGIVCIW